jgi:hypothetical protein
MNKEGLFARQLEKHKTAVANAETSIQLPLNSLLSADNGNIVTEQDAENIAFHIENSKTLSKLRFTLRVKKGATAGCGDVCEEALDVINKWRELSSHACICVLRDALHKAGLSEVDDTVFGHIVDQTLTKAEAKVTQISIPTKSDSQSKGSQISEMLSKNKLFQAVLRLGVAQWHSIGLQLGLTGSQINSYTSNIPELSSKLEALIELKIRECGEEETEKLLTSACERIPQPIIGSVNDFIKSAMLEEKVPEALPSADDGDSHP